ncbi:MAG: (2Fe-2S)-binding protein [Verrucomicrobiales bacterium]|nr:(2Fe-2S)-binding protein [Verrucomicrobiales bacterium]
MCPAQRDPKSPERRGFFKEALSVLIGGVISLVPVAAGITVFFDPLRRNKAKGGGAIRVASLSALRDIGVPQKFPVISSRVDAWNKYPQTPIGAVYLMKTDDKTIKALNVACPHAGCFVDYNADRNTYLCPCHNSSFALDGTVRDPKSPSPRALDELKVEVRDGEIFVHFQNFRAGVAEKIPEA